MGSRIDKHRGKSVILERAGRVVKIEPSRRARKWNLFVPREFGWELANEIGWKTVETFFEVAESVYVPVGRRQLGDRK